MPTYSQPQSDLGENATHEELWEHYCNKPTILSWHEAMPEGVNRILEKDWRKNGTRSYRKYFVRLYKDDYKETRKPGEFYKQPTRGGKQGHKGKSRGKRSNMAPQLFTEEGLTVEYRAVEKSAKMLCDSKTAMGPDYVNVPEGLFCRSEFVSFIVLWCALVKFSSLPLLSPCPTLCSKYDIANFQFHSVGQDAVSTL